MGYFEIHAYTPEHLVTGESSTITALLDSDAVDIFHLRHPQTDSDALEAIIKEIPVHLHPRISIHDNHDLAVRYGCGIHLTGRNHNIPAGFHNVISASCHTLDEVVLASIYGLIRYVTLSPIYDSISKENYNARFSLDNPALRNILALHRVIALGGVKPDKFVELDDAGFSGAAMLGYLPFDNPRMLDHVIKEISANRP